MTQHFYCRDCYKTPIQFGFVFVFVVTAVGFIVRLLLVICEMLHIKLKSAVSNGEYGVGIKS